MNKKKLAKEMLKEMPIYDKTKKEMIDWLLGVMNGDYTKKCPMYGYNAERLAVGETVDAAYYDKKDSVKNKMVNYILDNHYEEIDEVIIDSLRMVSFED